MNCFSTTAYRSLRTIISLPQRSYSIGTMSSAKPLVLFFNPVRHAKAVYEDLQKVARTEVVTSKSREGFYQDLNTKYQEVTVIYRTSASGAVGYVFITCRST